MSAILDYYAGAGRDGAGRTLAQTLALSPQEKETRHDFIQWLFPLDQPSRFNPGAPLLRPDDVEAFRTRPELRARLLESLDAMLAFYALRRDPQRGEILPAREDWPSGVHWLGPGDHNHLRLSRMVQSLALLGEEEWGSALRDRLVRIAAEHPDRVSPATTRVWNGLLAPP
jgi:hypothetical protein